jgi:hypothetical protein
MGRSPRINFELHLFDFLIQVFYVSKSVLAKVMQGVTHEGLKKLIQFVTIFYLFQDGKPMLEYEGMKACCNSFK